MTDVVATGIFTLAGVLLGGLLSPFTQLYLERKREQREGHRAKLLIADELLHAQLILRSVSNTSVWPSVEDEKAFLPTSAWQQYRSSLVGNVSDDLREQLVMTYAILEYDRSRFLQNGRSPIPTTLLPQVAQSFKIFSYELGQLRRPLGGSGAWLDDTLEEFKPRVARLNDNFAQHLAGLTDDELEKETVIAELRQRAKDLGDLNRDLGDNGAWSTKISDSIERRLSGIREKGSLQAP